MRDELHEVSIGEIAEIFDGPHATPRKTSDGPVFLGISNLSNGRIDLDNTEHLSEDDFKRWTRRVESQEGDIVFSYETRLGEAALIPSGLRCCLGRRMGLLRARSSKVDGRFLLYAYLGSQFQETLRSRTIHGSTVDRIPLIDMPGFPIEVPESLAEQRAIAHILGTLEEKIELNRRMNETWEAMAWLIHRFLKSGVFTLECVVEPAAEGMPQGSPLSPLLANLLLDDLDKELERRGHRFVRYADDGNIYVQSRWAGVRVKASVTRFLERRLKLKVNEAKSAVDRPSNRKFLGFTFTRGRVPRRKVSAKAVLAFKVKVRELTSRTRGRTMRWIVAELRRYILGWKGHNGFAEVTSPLHDLDKWIRRRLRSYHWKQWGRRGYRELRKRAISRDLAWNTSKSAHGPWRLSRIPALAMALPVRHFAALGLPSLGER